jgi:hypothetical protein
LPISEGYGRKGCRFFVNSAQAWSRDRVDEKFGPESKADGSVPLAYIETLVSEADLVGRWAIRSYIQGKGYSRETALTIMRELREIGMLREIRDIGRPTVREVPYMWKADLDDYLDARKAGVREGQLERAAALKQRPWVWRLSGPRSDD